MNDTKLSANQLTIGRLFVHNKWRTLRWSLHSSYANGNDGRDLITGHPSNVLWEVSRKHVINYYQEVNLLSDSLYVTELVELVYLSHDGSVIFLQGCAWCARCTFNGGNNVMHGIAVYASITISTDKVRGALTWLFRVIGDSSMVISSHAWQSCWVRYSFFTSQGSAGSITCGSVLTLRHPPHITRQNPGEVDL